MSKIYSRCPTCERPASKPHRSLREDGTIRSGCVDGFHTGRLKQGSNDEAWHMKPANVKWRAREDVENLRKAVAKRGTTNVRASICADGALVLAGVRLQDFEQILDAAEQRLAEAMDRGGPPVLLDNWRRQLSICRAIEADLFS